MRVLERCKAGGAFVDPSCARVRESFVASNYDITAEVGLSAVTMAMARQAEDKIEAALQLDHPGHVHGGGGVLTEDTREPTTTEANASVTETSVTRDSDHTLAELEKDTAVNSYAPSDRISTEEHEARPHRHHGVDVLGAEKEFAELQRTLTGLSQASRKLSRTQSRRSHAKGAGAKDVEKAISSEPSDEAEPFDLEDTLRGNKQLEDEAGIKSKHIGVLWDDLTVRGVGGSKIFVQTFPDAFTNFFLFPFRTIVGALGLGRKGKEVDILKGFRGVARPGEMVLVLGKPGSG